MSAYAAPPVRRRALWPAPSTRTHCFAVASGSAACSRSPKGYGTIRSAVPWAWKTGQVIRPARAAESNRSRSRASTGSHQNRAFAALVRLSKVLRSSRPAGGVPAAHRSAASRTATPPPRLVPANTVRSVRYPADRSAACHAAASACRPGSEGAPGFSAYPR